MTTDPNACQACSFVLKDIDDLKKNQKDRPCGANSTAISGLIKSDEDQWAAINDLRHTVWGWKGGMALASFLGGIVGTGLMTLLVRHFIKG